MSMKIVYKIFDNDYKLLGEKSYEFEFLTAFIARYDFANAVGDVVYTNFITDSNVQYIKIFYKGEFICEFDREVIGL